MHTVTHSYKHIPVLITLTQVINCGKPSKEVDWRISRKHLWLSAAVRLFCLFVCFVFVFFAFPLHLLSSPGTFSNLPPSSYCLYVLPLGASRSVSLPCFLSQSGLASAGQRSAVCTFSPAEEDLPTFMALSPPPSLSLLHPLPLSPPRPLSLSNSLPAGHDPPARSWMCFDSRPVHNQTAQQQLMFFVRLLPLLGPPHLPLQSFRAHVGSSTSGGTRPVCGSRWELSRCTCSLLWFSSLFRVKQAFSAPHANVPNVSPSKWAARQTLNTKALSAFVSCGT